MPHLAALIIADDLTGALDSIAPFAAMGMRCLVATSAGSLSDAVKLAPDVISINLGTRELGADQAEQIARHTALAARPHITPQTIWIKKIDSRMKGHVAAEVAAVAGVAGATHVVLCPAIPELGRTVIQGKLDGSGVAAPIALGLPPWPGVTVRIPDARSDADLNLLAQSSPPGTLFVGARGLAAALARHLRPHRQAAPAPMPTGPVGFCIGSRDPITLAQIETLRQGAALPWLAAPDGQVPPMAPKGGFVLQASQGAGATGRQVSEGLARGLLGHLAGLSSLVVSGGETAAALLHAAGIGVLHVRGEVLPGLPLCHAMGQPDFPAIVTKSGGFGAPETLLLLWQAARNPTHSQKGHAPP